MANNIQHRNNNNNNVLRVQGNKTAQEQQEVATKNVFFSGFGAHKA